MTDDDAYYVCERCGNPIEPDAADTVRAVRMVRTVAMEPTIEYTEGLPVLFHAGCYPDGSPDYRRVVAD